MKYFETFYESPSICAFVSKSTYLIDFLPKFCCLGLKLSSKDKVDYLIVVGIILGFICGALWGRSCFVWERGVLIPFSRIEVDIAS